MKKIQKQKIQKLLNFLLYSGAILYIVWCIVFCVMSIARFVMSLPKITGQVVTNVTISSWGGGVLVPYSLWWSIVLTVLIIVGAILGYYSGLGSGCYPILMIFVALPLCISYLTLGIWGFLVVAIITVIAVLKGASDMRPPYRAL